MVSKYDVHWVRIGSGHYMRMPNGNYEIFKKKDGWMVQWFNLWNGKKIIVANRIPTYSDAKRICERYNDEKVKSIMKRWK